MGYQVPYDGQGYGGIRLFIDPANPYISDTEYSRNYREYLAVRLTQPLVAGASYNISFKYSVGDKAELTTDDLGIYISKTPIPFDRVLTYTPQIRNPEGHLLVNTTTWETLGGSYTAEGGEEYVVIGCFLPYDQITISNFQPTIPRDFSAYVFVDYVVVEACTNSIPPQFLAADREVCDDFSSFQYNLSFPNTSYTWQDGSTSGSYTVTAPGKYWLKTVQDGCIKVDTVKFLLSDVYALELGNDVTLCPGAELSLSANVSGTFLWQNGSTDAHYTVTAPGHYTLEVHTAVGCSSSDDIEVSYEQPIPVDLGPDVALCQGKEFTLAPVYDGTYTWQDGSSATSYTVTQAGIYSLTVTTDNNCSYTDKVIIIFEDKRCDPDPGSDPDPVNAIIPNIITPNGDHLNDTFEIISDHPEQVWSVTIYNRWGQRVFTSANYDNDWGDLDTAAGVYFYVVTNSSIDFSYQGSLQVLH
jgi:gliding motility-associated-like protein